jgi:ABC-2 type transport system permease protein
MLVIAAREYRAAVQTKAFIIGLLIMPLMMGGSAVAQKLLRNVRDTTEKRVAVVDRTGGQIYAVLQAALSGDVPGFPRPNVILENVPPSADNPEAIAQQRYDLSERVRRGELFAFLEIGKDVFDVPPLAPAAFATGPDADPTDYLPEERFTLRYQSNRPTYDEFRRWADVVVTEAVRKRRADQLGLSAEDRRELAKRVPLISKGLSRINPQTGAIEDATESGRVAPFLVPAALMMLMFIVVMMGSTPLMQGVVEEKMQRIAEVLLGSVAPFQLMMGKLLGMTAVSMTIAGVYLAGGYWAAREYGFAEYVSGGLLAWFVVFQVLSSLMFGSLFIAIGAACTDMKETQNLLWPVMLLACLPLFIIHNVLQEPNSAAAVGLSFFPFATPMLMVARQAVPPGIGWWQPLVGAAGVLLTTILCVYAAGRIFRVGLLMQGKGAKLSDLFRWVIRG